MTSVLEGIAISAAGRVLGQIVLTTFRKRKAKSVYDDFDLDRFPERELDFVGIRNTGQKSIDGCLIYAGGLVCDWWDNHLARPRIIASGGGGNVIIPAAESNPLIEVMSREQTLRKIRFLDITPRT
jgi:hypothetical protein